jgi:hypothetical protein
LVLACVFLALLPVVLVAVKARSDDSSKKAGGTPTLQKVAGDGNGPLGGAGGAKPDAAKPDEAKRPGKPKADSAKPKPDSRPKLQGGEEAILKALEEETAIEFVDTSLKNILYYLSQTHRIPIHIDSVSLKEAGVEESTPITCNLSGVSLRSALEIVLDGIGLKWAIHHDVLMITSPVKAESDEYIYTKFYEVADLLATAKDCDVHNPLAQPRGRQEDYRAPGGGYFALPPERGPALGAPPPAPAADSAGRSGMGLCLGVGTVPAHNMVGAGAVAGPPSDTALTDLIINNIATKTWADNGGIGTISLYDRMLVISQTREVHMQIEQILADLRARRQARPTLSVELQWLWLDAKQRDHLLAGQAKPSAGQLSLAVDPERLRQIARDVPGFYGRVACVNGIGTALAAGDRRTVIQGAVPVVGGEDVGYQPIINIPNVGVTAQVRPTVVPGTKTATLDISSIITRWDPSRKPAIIGAVRTVSTQGGSSSCPVDRPVMPTQQIGATLSVPLGKPVIVGAMTFAVAEDAGLGAADADLVQVYLVATTSIVREDPK